MAVSGKFEGIGLDDIYGVGQRADVPGYRTVVREVRDAVDEWPGYAASAEIDDDTIKMVGADIERFRPR
jgi:hypothetical protein